MPKNVRFGTVGVRVRAILYICNMEDYVIIVNRIEELQLTQDRTELELILDRAKRTIVGGQDVILVRQNRNGQQEKFQTISSEQDFEEYRKQVLRFL